MTLEYMTSLPGFWPSLTPTTSPLLIYISSRVTYTSTEYYFVYTDCLGRKRLYNPLSEKWMLKQVVLLYVLVVKPYARNICATGKLCVAKIQAILVWTAKSVLGVRYDLPRYTQVPTRILAWVYPPEQSLLFGYLPKRIALGTRVPRYVSRGKANEFQLKTTNWLSRWRTNTMLAKQSGKLLVPSWAFSCCVGGD